MKRWLCIMVCLMWQQGANAMEQQDSKTARAIFAGGCFWCMEPVFHNTEGVVAVASGYTGGAVKNPTYEQVSTGATGHFEANEVVYDPAKVRYETLLERYWANIDPLDGGGQFFDRGPQYRTAIFYVIEEQKTLAEASKQAMEKKLGRKIATEILPAGEFYPAEDYHQDYYKKNPVRYNAYKKGSGREEKLQDIWGVDK